MTTPADGAKTRRWGYPHFFLLTLFLITLIICLQFWQCIGEGKCAFAEDFEVFWRAGRFAAAQDAAHAYDVEQAAAWVNGASGAPAYFHPYLNPPFGLLMLAPLGIMPYPWALCLWYAVQAAFLIAALRTDYARRYLSRYDSRVDLLVLLFPFAVLTLLAGQVGLLSAALFLFTLALRKSRPVASGVALAFLAFKPQLGLVLPLLLIRERNWLALRTAVQGIILLVLASLLAWGLLPWLRYEDMLHIYRVVLAAGPTQYINVSASPYMAMRMLGIDNIQAALTQAAFSIVILVFLWRLLAVEIPEPVKILALATATFLISPYAFLYDTAPLAFACVVLLLPAHDGRATPLARIALVVLAFVPIVALKLQVMHIPYALLALLAGFAVALAQSREETGR